jgi:hypothetical protein
MSLLFPNGNGVFSCLFKPEGQSQLAGGRTATEPKHQKFYHEDQEFVSSVLTMVLSFLQI